MSQSRPSDLELAKKLGEARMRLLKRTPFLTILLLQMHYALDDSCATVYTDAEQIVFGPNFLEQLSQISIRLKPRPGTGRFYFNPDF